MSYLEQFLLLLVSVFVENMAYADNCGTLSDCYGTIKAATGVGVGIAVTVMILGENKKVAQAWTTFLFASPRGFEPLSPP